MLQSVSVTSSPSTTSTSSYSLSSLNTLNSGPTTVAGQTREFATQNVPVRQFMTICNTLTDTRTQYLKVDFALCSSKKSVKLNRDLHSFRTMPPHFQVSILQSNYRTHGVWKSQKKSHSTLRAKRATFTCQKFIENAKNGQFWRFLKI